MSPTIIPPTKAERVLRAVSYLLVGAIGVWAAFHANTSTAGPLLLSRALGYDLTLVWSLLMVTALVAAPAAFLGRFQIEYATLPWFATAVIVATAWTWLWVAQYPTVVGHALLATAFSVQLVQRYLLLRKLIRNRGKLWTPSSK